MWQISPEKKVVGFQHGLEKSSERDANDTRVLFLTERNNHASGYEDT